MLLDAIDSAEMIHDSVPVAPGWRRSAASTWLCKVTNEGWPNSGTTDAEFAMPGSMFMLFRS